MSSSGDPRTTLSPGDLVVWDPELEGYAPSVMAVSEDGQELLFQFGTKPWSQMGGLGVSKAEHVLRHGHVGLGPSGYIFKSYDKATNTSYGDPRLDG